MKRTVFGFFLASAIIFGCNNNEDNDNPNNGDNSGGTEKWAADLGNSGYFLTATPAIDDQNNSYHYGVSYDNYPEMTSEVFCIDPNGTINWQTSVNYEITTELVLLENGNILAGTSSNSLISFNQSGQINWDYNFGDCQVVESPAIAEDGTIYQAVSAYYDMANDKTTPLSLKAIAQDGTLLWEQSFDDTFLANSSPVIADNIIYLLTETSADETSTSVLFALEMNGNTIWTANIPSGSRNDPAIANNGNIYITANDGNLYCYTSSGAQNWTFSTGGKIWTSPVTDANDNVYFGSYDNFVYCIDANGNMKWTSDDFQSNPEGAALIAQNNTIYFSLMSLNAFNGENGETTMKNEDHFFSSPVAVDRNGNIIVGGTGKVFCYGSTTEGLHSGSSTPKMKINYANTSRQ